MVIDDVTMAKAAYDDDLFMAHFRMAIYGVLTPIVITLGVLGNFVTLWVMGTVYVRSKYYNKGDDVITRQWGPGDRTMYLYLTTLSLADLGYLAFTAQNCYFSWSEGADTQDLFYIYHFMVPLWNSFKGRQK